MNNNTFAPRIHGKPTRLCNPKVNSSNPIIWDKDGNTALVSEVFLPENKREEDQPEPKPSKPRRSPRSMRTHFYEPHTTKHTYPSRHYRPLWATHSFKSSSGKWNVDLSVVHPIKRNYYQVQAPTCWWPLYKKYMDGNHIKRVWSFVPGEQDNKRHWYGGIHGFG